MACIVNLKLKNDVGNVVSDADGMKNIWRKYLGKLINVENACDGEVYFPQVDGSLLSHFGRRGCSSYQRIKMGKQLLLLVC